MDTVADLARVSEADLVAIFGQAHGAGLHRLARAEDDRPVVVEREAKSISVEQTFETDITDRAVLEGELRQMAAGLAAIGLFAGTFTHSMLTMRGVRTAAEGGTVPGLAVLVAIVLVIACIVTR